MNLVVCDPEIRKEEGQCQLVGFKLAKIEWNVMIWYAYMFMNSSSRCQYQLFDYFYIHTQQINQYILITY